MDFLDHKFNDKRDVMNAVGIDVAEGRSMVAITQSFGVVAAEPFV